MVVEEATEDAHRMGAVGPEESRMHLAGPAPIGGVSPLSGQQPRIFPPANNPIYALLCRGCGAFVQCENCSIALTYHKSRQRLECHYCGYSVPPLKRAFARAMLNGVR